MGIIIPPAFASLAGGGGAPRRATTTNYRSHRYIKHRFPPQGSAVPNSTVQYRTRKCHTGSQRPTHLRAHTHSNTP